MNALINYPGSKWGMAKEIISSTRRSYNQNADQRTEVLWCSFELPEQQKMEGL